MARGQEGQEGVFGCATRSRQRLRSWLQMPSMLWTVVEPTVCDVLILPSQ